MTGSPLLGGSVSGAAHNRHSVVAIESHLAVEHCRCNLSECLAGLGGADLHELGTSTGRSLPLTAIVVLQIVQT
jgi:hypothetical protein